MKLIGMMPKTGATTRFRMNYQMLSSKITIPATMPMPVLEGNCGSSIH